jgi:hypothetical protein
LANNWSKNELHYQRGKLDNPFAKNKETHDIFTLQHASGWKYGGHFFFIDIIQTENNDGFNDDNVHGEFYSDFSYKKIFNPDFNSRLIKDYNLTLGYDFTSAVKSRKLMPGVKIAWNVPSFKFVKTLFAGYLDHNKGLAAGGTAAEDDTYIIDTAYHYDLPAANGMFNIEGHLEFVGERDRENGTVNSDWILSQLQFRWDLGHMIHRHKGKVFLGTEWQYWKNKLGVKGVDENQLQLLLVWRM